MAHNHDHHIHQLGGTNVHDYRQGGCGKDDCCVTVCDECPKMIEGQGAYECAECLYGVCRDCLPNVMSACPLCHAVVCQTCQNDHVQAHVAAYQTYLQQNAMTAAMEIESHSECADEPTWCEE